MYKYIIIALLVAGYNIKPGPELKSNLEVKRNSKGIYLLFEINNNSNRNYYINDCRLYEYLKVYNSQGIDITQDFLGDEFQYHINRSKPPHPSELNDNDERLMTYSDLNKRPITETKQLIKKAIDIESKKIINNQQLNSKNSSEVKEILFWKYANAKFIKAHKSYKDSIAINTLFRSESQQYKLVIDYTPRSKRHKDKKINIELNNKKDSVSISYKSLPKINDYLLYNKPIKDSLQLK